MVRPHVRLNADDAIFAAGYRIGLVLTAELSNPDADVERIRLTIAPAGSMLTLPIQATGGSLLVAGPTTPVKARAKAQPEPEKDPAELMRQLLEAWWRPAA